MKDFFEKSLLQPPSEIMIEGLSFLEGGYEGKEVLDLGCGSGRDAFELLKRGFLVTAVDGSSLGLEMLEGAVDPKFLGYLNIIESHFEDLVLPKNTFDFIHASFSLPFCRPEKFSDFMQIVFSSLKVGGIFCGHFFGPKDDWITRESMTFVNESQIRKFLKGCDILKLKEVEEFKPGTTSPPKNWHLFHVIARAK